MSRYVTILLLLAAAAYAQPFTYSPDPVDCGTACLTRTSLGMVTITNTSSDTYYLHMTAATHTGPFCLDDATDWVGVNHHGEYGDQYVTGVQFNSASCSASGIGTYNGSVSIPYYFHTNDASPAGWLTINCTGEMIGVIELTTTPENYDYGSVRVGNTASHGFVISNTGQTTATVYDLNWENNDADAYSTDAHAPFDIAVGGQITIHVYFAPQAAQDYSNVWLNLRYHDCGGSQTNTGAGFNGTGFAPDGIREGDSPPDVSEFRLVSVFPNPFNPSTTIEYYLNRSEQVRLSVFDTAGREVAVLATGLRAAGRYRATFDGSRIATGVYFVRLWSANSDGSVRKILLLK